MQQQEAQHGPTQRSRHGDPLAVDRDPDWPEDFEPHVSPSAIA
jgi:hypothetical protein